MDLFPSTIQELAAIVRHAHDQNDSLVPMGAGTRQHIGRPADHAARIVRMTALNRMITHVPADMTVTIEAGMALGDLQQRLREYNQWLPWDPPTPPEATIGGLLASAASGPLRLGYGTPRDWVLGMRAVLGDGRLVKSGGNVVKNVAGYDLHKLHIGALGTLGIIGEITMKVFPTPEQISSVATRTSSLQAALAQAELLRTAPLVPVSLVIVSDNHEFQVFARYAGVKAGVHRQLAMAQERVSETEVIEDDRQLWQAQSQFAQPNAQEQDLIVRVGAAPSKLELVLSAMREYASNQAAMIGYVGVGIGYIRWHAGTEVAARLQGLRTTLQPYGGYAVVEYAPGPLSHTLDLWGLAPQTLPLMRALKSKWDSHGVLNRGRYL